MSNTTSSSCVVLSWSEDTFGTRIPIFAICLIAVPIHIIFWIHLLFYRSVRQIGMIWLYIYLISDLFLVFRFLLFYGQRVQKVCIPQATRIYLCYFEAVTKIYTNIIQSYILLGLNVCRYIQIVYNHNVYTKNLGTILFMLILIFILPLANIAFQFPINWAVLSRRLGSLCDIAYTSAGVQVYNLFIVYIIPVSLNLLFLGLCIRFLSSTSHIENQQIRNNRQKFHRTILVQSIRFYSVWIVLWSPFVLSFQFININSLTGISTTLLNFIQIAIDPAVVALIDVRFMKAWKSTCRKLVNNTQRQIQPTSMTTTTGRRH